jgi:hypothetical protein
MERIHKWDKDDTILTLYYVKHGVRGLPVRDEIDLAEGVIGTTKSSLIMQGANIRYVLGEDEGVLDCFSHVQEEVVNEYNDLSYEELKDICIGIIAKRDVDQNLEKVRKMKKLQLAEKKKRDKKKKNQEELDEIFRRMGKDPSKMRKVTT